MKEKTKEIVGAGNFEFLGHAKDYLSAQFFVMALGLVSVPVFTRLLSRADYGTLSVFDSFIMIFTVFLGLNIKGSIVVYYNEENQDFDGFLGSNVVFIALFNVAAVAVIFFFAGAIAREVGIERNLLFAAALVSAFAVPADLFLNCLVAARKSGGYAIFSTLQAAALLAVAAAWVWSLTDGRYWGRVHAALAVTGLFSAYALYRLVRASKISLNPRHLKYSLTFGVPLIPHVLATAGLAYFDRIIIVQLAGAADAGLYSVAYRVGMAMDAVIMAANKAWAPMFYEALREGRHEKIGRLASSYARYIYFCAIGLILFSREAVVLLADSEFHAAAGIVPIIVLSYAFLFLYTLYAGFSFYRKRTALISLNTVIACGANIGLNYWLIPRYGYSAAAYTTLASYMLLFVLHYLSVRLALKETALPLKLVLPNLLLVCASVACLAAITKYIPAGLPAFAAKAALVSLAGYWFLLRKKHENGRSGGQVSGIRG